MIVVLQPRVNWIYVWALLFFAIYYLKGVETKWERKREIAAVTLLILTILIIPLHLWGTYNINGMSNQGMSFGSSDSFDLAPEETYTSLALSNVYSESYGYLVLSAVGGTCTFYICDENNPERYVNFTEFTQTEIITYTEINFTDSEYISYPLHFRLPYHYSELNVVAIWTLNFYNPSQTEQISVTFGITVAPHTGSTPNPLLKYYEPTQALVGLWVVAAFVTLLSHVDRKRKQRTTIPEIVDNLETEDSKSHDEL